MVQPGPGDQSLSADGSGDPQPCGGRAQVLGVPLLGWGTGWGGCRPWSPAPTPKSSNHPPASLFKPRGQRDPGRGVEPEAATWPCAANLSAHLITQTHIHTRTHTLIHTYIHTHISTHSYTDACTQIHGYTKTHTYTDTHTHRRTDTHAHPEMLHPLRRTSLQV